MLLDELAAVLDEIESTPNNKRSGSATLRQTSIDDLLGTADCSATPALLSAGPVRDLLHET